MQRYQKCLTCEKRGISCDGPNLLTLPAQELIEFCKSVRAIRGMSIGELAEGSGIAKGTIGRIFSTESTMDFRYETIRAIALYLCDCKFLGNPCPAPSDWEAKRLEDRLQHQKDLVLHMEGENKRVTELYDGLLSYHKDYTRFVRRTIIVMGTVIGVLAATLITMLIIDATVPELGFFFHRS